MSERQKLIKEMLEMQRKFIQLEQAGEFSAADYYADAGDNPLADFRARYNELAMQLVDLSHAEKGSHR